MGIQINGNTNNINAGIGSLSIEDINELDIVGVATAANFKTGVSNLHNVGLTLSGGQIDVGSNIKIGTAGVITATSFIGSGANLTGIDTDLVSDTSPQLGGDLQSNGSDILIADNDYLKIGTGNDLTFRHDAAGGNHSYIMHSGAGDFKIGSDTTFYLGKTGPETFIKAIPDGAVELYHNNLKKLETNSSGAKVYGSLLVDSVLDISPPGSNAVLIKNPANGIIGFGANNQTNQVIITTAGHLGITGDNQELRLGASEDLKLYHDGSHSRIVDSGTGHLKIQGSKVQLLNADGSEEYLSAQNGGGVKLRHNNVVKLECTSAGATVTGTCSATSFSGDGSNLTGLSTPLSFRNKIINGSQQIFQRGTSDERYGGNDGYYNGIADRWAIRMHSSVAQTTYSKDTSDTPDGFGSCQKSVRSNAGSASASKYYVYDTKLEGQDLQDFAKGTSSAKEFTLSFYVKTGVSGVYCCEMRDLDNNRMVGGTYTVSNGNWNRYIITFPADTTGAFDNDNGASLWVRFWLAAGSNFTSGTARTTWASGAPDSVLAVGQTAQVGDNVADTWRITGIQLEVGSTATAFEHRSYADEFRRCARYCYQWIDDQQLGFGQVYSGSGYIKIFPPIPVNMRAKPSVTKNAPSGYWFVSYHGNSGYAGDRNVSVEGNSGDDNLQSANSFRIFVHGGSNQGNAVTCWCLIHDTAGAYLRLEAEL